MKTIKKYFIVRDIIKKTKNKYGEVCDALEDEPKKLRRIVHALIIVTFIAFSLEMAFIIFPSLTVIILFVLSCVGLIILWILGKRAEKEFSEFRKAKQADIKDLLYMAVDDIAKELDVNEQELVIFLIKNYKPNILIWLCCFVVTIVMTGISVYYLPAYESEYGLKIFALLVSANCFSSFASSWLNKRLYSLDEFDFYFVEPYKEAFSKIEKYKL